MKRFFSRHIPTREQILGNRYLRWIAPWLEHDELWEQSAHRVALGTALGIFFGIISPIAQSLLAVVFAVLLKANVIAAVASTLITNPFTAPPIYYAAYRTGAAILQTDATSATPHLRELKADVSALREEPSLSTVERYWQHLRGLGKPLVVGVSLFAVLGAFLAYVLVYGIFALWAWRRKRRGQPLP